MKYFKNKQIKIFALLLSLTFISSLFSSCSIIHFKSPKVSEIITNIKKNNDLSSLNKSTKSKLRKLYGISYKTLEDFALYIPKTNMEANELLILKVKNQDDIDSIKERIEKRIEKQSNTFKDYAPNQYELLENHILKVKGPYLIFIVSKNANNIMININDSFK
ncbi:DUF4358 domain-containing protein [Clostridium oceanicum]|uniref:DUF4358 domain-containing protein n=1 Tax=Clostridium oceanicum TaxID=1543 RepID=A0ABN1J8B9_9CLOT